MEGNNAACLARCQWMDDADRVVYREKEGNSRPFHLSFWLFISNKREEEDCFRHQNACVKKKKGEMLFCVQLWRHSVIRADPVVRSHQCMSP